MMQASDVRLTKRGNDVEEGRVAFIDGLFTCDGVKATVRLGIGSVGGSRICVGIEATVRLGVGEAGSVLVCVGVEATV